MLWSLDESTNPASDDGRLCSDQPVQRVEYKNLIEHIYDPPCVKGCDTTGAILQDIYTPLAYETIRLVHLKRLHPNSSIPECSLIESRIHDSSASLTMFTAVSYTWLAEEYSWYGVELPESTTMVIQNHRISVPSRIALILGVLFETGVRTVWIDYLSINQLHIVERGRQVSIMNRIFEAAAQTVIFLGKPTAGTDILFARPPPRPRIRDEDPLDQPDVRCAEDQILQHRYWQRAWVLQEIAFSQKIWVICGSSIVGSERFCSLIQRATIFFCDNFDVQILWDFTDCLLKGYVRRAIENWSLRDIMWSTICAECRDPRDAIYSKVHLAQNGHNMGHADYTENVGSLFTRFAISNICLGHLTIASGCANRLHMPSWVVDWTPQQRSSCTNLLGAFRDFIEGAFPPYKQLFLPHEQLTPTAGRSRMFITDDHKELVVLGRVVMKMRPFTRCRESKAHIEQPKPELAEEPALEDCMVYGETFLCLVYGCYTLLVLEWRDSHFVMWNINESDAVKAWAETELEEAALQGHPKTYNFYQFRIR